MLLHRLSLFALLLIALHVVGVVSLAPQEIEALKDMQLAWNISSWQGAPNCSWFGIFCNNNDNVVEVYLFYLLFFGSNNFFIESSLEKN